MMPLYALGFIIGAMLGSFVNVLICRMPHQISVVWPRSHCPKCQHLIAWYDNIPLLSFILLRRQCRHCHIPIGWRYFIVELVLGCLSLLFVQRYGLSVAWAKWLFFSCVLIAITYIDMQALWVPLSLLITLLAGAALFALLEHRLLTAAIGALGGGLFLLAVLVVSTFVFRATGRLTKEQYAMGFADPLLLAGIGGFIGWRLLPMALFLACAQGFLMGLFIVWRQKPAIHGDDVPKGAIAFGPFLALGALEVVMLWGNQI